VGYKRIGIARFLFESRAGKIAAKSAGFKAPFYGAARDKAAGRVQPLKIIAAAAGTARRSVGVKSRTQAAIKAAAA